ncbi:YicC/YloC family endoribonuclease, partial [Pseudomonadota bacterium]
MSVSSMTGFARAEGSTETCAWVWEAKSVNGKGLDIRLRLPRGFDAFDALVRDLVGKRFKRGNVSVNLDVSWTQPQSVLAVNDTVLEQILAAADKVQAALP